jgi:hypothetical protein
MKNALLALAALLLLYAAIALTYRLAVGPQSRPADVVFERAEAAQSRAANWPSEPLGLSPDARPSAELIRMIRSALPPSLRDRRESADAPEGAIAAALEFISMIGTGDPAAYIEWRETQGFAFLDRLPRTPSGDSAADRYDYAFTLYRKMPGDLVGDSPPSELPPREAFGLLFSAYASQDEGSLRPVAVATAPRAAEVHLKRITHPDDHMRYVPFAEDGLGSRFWIGGTTGTFLPWFAYQRSLQEIVDAHGGVWLARIQLSVRGARGHLIPTRLLLFHDPAAGWRVKTWSLGNIGEHTGVTDAIPLGIY